MNFSNGHALIIGIANYPHVSPLPAAVLKDARDVASVIKSEQCGYEAEKVKLLIDEEATADAIRSGLSDLAERANGDDTVVIFFSGHGGESETGADAGNYLIPFDCDTGNLAETAIAGNELTDFFRQIQSERLLVIFDCCYAGGTANPKDALFSPQDAFLKSYSEETYDRLAQGKGRVIIASSRPDQVSLLLSGMDNSLFTHYLLEALRGETRTRADGLIRVFDLFDYVSEKVPSRATQNPIFKTADFENNFPVALWRGGEKAAIGTEATRPVPTQVDRTELREQIVEYFDLDELEVLCADIEQDLENNGEDLKVDLDEFGGGKTTKVLKLIKFLDRRNRLSYLVAAVRRTRSGSGII